MVAVQIIYSVIDDSNDTAQTSLNFPLDWTIAQFGEFGVAMATLLDALLSGKVEKAELCVGIDISSLTSNTALSTSDIEEIGAFQFRTVSGFPVKMNLPCIDELLVLSGSDDLDQADADIVAFISAMESGIVTAGGTITPCDVGEDDIVSTDFARERFRASGQRR